MLHTKDPRSPHPVSRKSLRMSVVLSASLVTALFVNVAATGGAPLNAMPRSQFATFG